MPTPMLASYVTNTTWPLLSWFLHTTTVGPLPTTYTKMASYCYSHATVHHYTCPRPNASYNSIPAIAHHPTRDPQESSITHKYYSLHSAPSVTRHSYQTGTSILPNHYMHHYRVIANFHTPQIYSILNTVYQIQRWSGTPKS